MLNEVKVSRNLLSNRKRDLEIRLEDLASKLDGIKHSEIMRLEDLLERLDILKQQFVDSYEQKVKNLLTEVAEQSDKMEEKLEFLENVEMKIEQLQQVKAFHSGSRLRRGLDWVFFCQPRSYQRVFTRTKRTKTDDKTENQL